MQPFANTKQWAGLVGSNWLLGQRSWATEIVNENVWRWLCWRESAAIRCKAAFNLKAVITQLSYLIVTGGKKKDEAKVVHPALEISPTTLFEIIGVLSPIGPVATAVPERALGKCNC